jgi:hypothetical protein
MKSVRRILAVCILGSSLAAAVAVRAQAPTRQYFVEQLATNYTATIISGTNAASGVILPALSGNRLYTRIEVRPTGAPLVLNHGASASTNASPVYGSGTNYTWTATDAVRGPFRTGAVHARDARAGTNATTTAEVEAWFIEWQ